MTSTSPKNGPNSLLPFVCPHTVGTYQVDANRLARNLPPCLNFLRDPPMDMNDLAYKRLSNGRHIVEKREQVEETPTEVATEVDSNNERVLNYFDMDIEFGEEDMEIDEDFIDHKTLVVANPINSADTYFGNRSTHLNACGSKSNLNVAQEVNSEDKEHDPVDKESCEDSQ